VSVEVVRLLLRAGASEPEVEDALGRAVALGQTLAKWVSDAEPELEQRLERELERVEVPSLELVRAETEQLALLPPELAERLGVVPVRKDARSGRVDVAALDPLDAHVVTELEFHLGAKVRVLRADPAAITAALGGTTPPRSPSAPPIPLVRKVVPDDEPVLQLARPKAPRAAVPPGPLLPLGLAKAAFEQARTPDEVVTALVEGLAPARTLVLAVRATSYVGRGGSAAFEREAVRRVQIVNSSPSVVQTAASAGFYLGVLPHTPPHAELRAFFGESDDEVYVVSVSASGHPTLVVVCEPSALGASLESTRRIDALAAVAGQALERIVLRRKRGG
jgi:hypothetical protein